MTRRLSTGVEPVDDELGGGLPAGSVVALCAPPVTSSEMLLYELAGARETLYVTTTRSKAAVKAAFEAYPNDTGTPVVTEADRDVDFDELARIAGRAHASANIVIDTVGVLERADRDAYCSFLRDLSAHVRSIDGLAVLHCHRLPAEPSPPGRRLTLGMADATLELERHASEAAIDHRLLVTKLRGGTALTAPITLELDDAVRVDTTRDLA
ncbi:transcriptional regulator [Halobacteriales archaeon QS_4_70_19]|nr:MAG: transcriptional regulator [Halobacteriales archaeon QS_4_70_19]